MADPLRKVLGERGEESNSEYVFTYAGEKLCSNVSRTWRRILKQAGITNCTLHTLRHTFASHLAMQGVPLVHIQQLMGHRDYKTTLVYAHLSKESVREQVRKFPFKLSPDVS